MLACTSLVTIFNHQRHDIIEVLRLHVSCRSCPDYSSTSRHHQRGPIPQCMHLSSCGYRDCPTRNTKLNAVYGSPLHLGWSIPSMASHERARSTSLPHLTLRPFGRSTREAPARVFTTQIRSLSAASSSATQELSQSRPFPSFCSSHLPDFRTEQYQSPNGAAPERLLDLVCCS